MNNYYGKNTFNFFCNLILININKKIIINPFQFKNYLINAINYFKFRHCSYFIATYFMSSEY